MVTVLSRDFYALGVSKNGSGTVASNPAGIDCGATCAATFKEGASVTLTAAPASDFVGWSGACAGDGVCMVTMDAAKSVTAIFITIPTAYALTVAKAGTGDGAVGGAGDYVAGATVTLTATPNTGSTFAGWSPSPCAASFTMPANNLTCTATFNAGAALPGDVNGDGSVNALDVVAVINHFLGTQTWPQADVNGDGAVNALDVVLVINKVLGV